MQITTPSLPILILKSRGKCGAQGLTNSPGDWHPRASPDLVLSTVGLQLGLEGKLGSYGSTEQA